MYWKSASPISIVENGARLYGLTTHLYLRVRNSGMYPLRITSVIGSDGGRATTFYNGGNAGCPSLASGPLNITDYYYLAPGEEKYFADDSFFGVPCHMDLYVETGASSGSFVGGASSVCQNSTVAPGTLDYKTFGFEYIEYIDGQQITKSQVGKELIVRCMSPWP